MTSLLQKPGVRYLLIGGSVYVLELAIIWAAQSVGLSAVAAVAVAFVIGTLVSFALQKLVTFGDKRKKAQIVGVQLAATIGLVIFNFGFTVLCTALLQKHLPAVAIRTGALLITTFWNFYLYRTRIFKPGATDEPLVY